MRMRFEAEKLMPRSEQMSVPLLRLLAATNDVILLQKLVIISRARSERANEYEKDVLNGELGYFVQMLCGHLYEAGIAFRALDAAYGDQIDKLMATDTAARHAFQALRDVYQDRSDTGFDRGVLGPIRNLAGFHYKEQTFSEGLEALRGRGEIVLSEHIGFTRYVITDDIMTRKAWESLGGTDEYREAVGKAFALADELAIAVTHLLKHRLDIGGVRVEETHGTIPIPPEILETRQNIDAERKML